MRTIICAACGRTVEKSGHARNVKYCPECREKVKREKDRIRSRHKAAKGGLGGFQGMDTPEDISICLDCPLSECQMTSLSCPLYGRKGA